MGTEPVRGPGAGAEGFREAQRALRQLAGRERGVSPERAERSEPASPAAGREAPRGKILSISFSEARQGVRPQKVHEARRRIAEGYYDRPDVRVRLAENLMRSFGEVG